MSNAKDMSLVEYLSSANLGLFTFIASFTPKSILESQSVDPRSKECKFLNASTVCEAWGG